MDEIFKKDESHKTKKYFRTFGWVAIVLLLFVVFWVFTLRPPQMDAPVLIHISKGDSVEFIANQLEDKNVVGSSKFLQSFIAFLGGDQKIKLGDYYFDEPIWLPNVAYRIVAGIHNINPIKVTIPEGSTNTEMVRIIKNKLPDINALALERAMDGKQGYLFPDTYFFYPLSTESEIVETLSATFDMKIKTFEMKGYLRSEEEIVIMASLVEEESINERDARLIAGILWQRLKIGMPLQVDVAPWTYSNKGLPQIPITNPGMRSLSATISPEETDYLYYLHDKNGMIHLAKTYTEHKNNIKKYLK